MKFDHFVAFVTMWILCALGTGAWAETAMLPEQRLTSLVFGEIDYRQREDLENDGFVLGQAVAQFNFQIDQHFSAFTEMTATAKKDQGFEFEIERFFVRYDFSDYFKLSGGRFHTPLGYWNSAYHHGSWLQTSISRPESVKFGSNILPIHFLGLLLEGNVGESSFGYRVGYGNGRSDDIHDPGDLGDVNSSGAWLFSGNYRPPGRNRLDTGISLYIDKVEPDLAPEIDEQIATAYLALEGESPELIVEYSYSNHESSIAKGQVHALYGQFAYRLRGKARKFKPYLRAERIDVDDSDPLVGDLGLDYEGFTIGTRWDFSSYAAFKAEFRREEFDNSGARNAFWLQLTFVFDATNRGQTYAANNIDPTNPALPFGASR